MTTSTPTLTPSGLLAVLLQRQRYRIFQLARRRAHRKRVHAAFWNTLTWGRPALTAPKLLDRPAPHLNLHQTNFARAAAALPPDSHVSPNQLHRTPATDPRRPADEISRMGRAKWRILHV